MTDSKELSTEDYQLLSQLIIEYGWRLDHGQRHMVHELMTSDGVISSADSTVTGKESIIEWGKNNQASDERNRHVMTNFYFRVLDDDRVEGTNITMTFIEGAVNPFSMNEVTWMFVRVNGKWKIASRSTQVLLRNG